ncbi:MAG: 4-alpha-glucanotransferase [Akkermansia sp.]|nr:4-alpha-glucanotransferase [Akkermansia sp.]
MLKQRFTGVLMPLFSLRRENDGGIGDLTALEQWIDWAADHGVGFLQLLPVNALGDDDAPSPYSAISSVALEPLYLSMERVPGMELPLPTYPEDLPPLQLPGGRDLVDYSRARAYKHHLLNKAWGHFREDDVWAAAREEFAAWVQSEGQWLEDYACFRVLSIAYGTTNWWLWPVQDVELARRLASESRQACDQKLYQQWLQWLCAREWAMVRTHADARGVLLMGDVPIGISVASSDVFFERYLFDMEWSGGAPAEGNFAEDPFTAKWGQNWGIPLYRWEVMEANGFAWWNRRIRKLAEIFSMYRIDHVLGFYRIYAFPWMPDRNPEFLPLSPDEAAARCGGRRPGFRPRPDWEPADRRANLMQGDRLLSLLLKAAPGLRVVGEDLGCVPDYVRPDLSRLRIAGFKIPHWEIDENQRIVRGQTYNPCSFATYATHDFPPLCLDWDEWFSHVQRAREAVKDSSLSGAELRAILRTAKDCGRVLAWLGDYANLPLEKFLQAWNPEIKDALYRALYACRSVYAAMMWTELFDVPVRLNTPGTEGGSNWRPRMPFTAAQAAAMPQSRWIREVSEASHRSLSK